jgi:hypothetical protein
VSGAVFLLCHSLDLPDLREELSDLFHDVPSILLSHSVSSWPSRTFYICVPPASIGMPARGPRGSPISAAPFWAGPAEAGPSRQAQG